MSHPVDAAIFRAHVHLEGCLAERGRSYGSEVLALLVRRVHRGDYVAEVEVGGGVTATTSTSLATLDSLL